MEKAVKTILRFSGSMENTQELQENSDFWNTCGADNVGLKFYNVFNMFCISY